MSNIGSNAGSGLRGGVHSVHGTYPPSTPLTPTPSFGKSIGASTDTTRGAGEAIRGQINAFADSAVGSNDSAAQNQTIADRGVNEFQTGSRTHNPGSSFDKHPSDVRAGGLRGNPAADNWGSNTTSTTGTYGHPSSTNAGPHGSNVANTADPRVDSDLSGRGTTGTYGYPSSTNAGPHGSNVANTADPRVDSDLSGRGTTGTYGHPSSTNAGPHGSNVANSADPRIDSDLSNRGTTGTYGHSSTNAGPHGSNVANTADPRVDSDLSNR
ncbi:hypothetical protein IWX90DRAFT_383812, partial [Phyllosticta citrichinensis]